MNVEVQAILFMSHNVTNCFLWSFHIEIYFTEVKHEFFFYHMDTIVSSDEIKSCFKSFGVLWLSKGSTGCPQRVILVGHSSQKIGRKQKVESTIDLEKVLKNYISD